MCARFLLKVCATILLSAAVGAAVQIAGAPAQGGEQFFRQGVGDPQQGRATAEAKCASCHGADGNSADPKYPKLAGQDPAYLYWQLWAFRKGTRRSDIMAGIVAALSDSDMADAASFYSRQSRQPDTVKDERLAAVGERIFFAGAGPGMSPPCAMCHGAPGQRGMPMMMGHMQMMGMMANAPNLSGQHAAYIIDQLNRFASGERPAMMMSRIAGTLSEPNKQAVAEYLSGLP